MSITFSCPNCLKQLRARDGEAGKAVQCPKCRGALRIPILPVVAGTQPLAPVADQPAEFEPYRPAVEIEHRLPDLTAGRGFRVGFGSAFGAEVARVLVGCLFFLVVVGAALAFVMIRIRG